MAKISFEVTPEEERRIKEHANRIGKSMDQLVSESVKAKLDHHDRYEAKDTTPGGWPLKEPNNTPESKL